MRRAALAVLVLAVGAPAADTGSPRPAVSVMQSLVSKSTPFSCLAPPAATSFRTGDPVAWLWFTYSGAGIGDRVSADWYYPNGSLYRTSRWAPLSASGNSCLWDRTDIAGYAPGANPGLWKVQVYWNDSQLLFELTFRIVGPSPTITSVSPLPPATVGKPYSYLLTATSGTPPYSWSTGLAPAGLSLSSSGQISGTPVNAGTFRFTVQLDDRGLGSVTKVFDLRINPGAPQITNSSNLPGGSIQVAYSFQLTASGGIPSYSWAVVSGTLPNGLTLDPGSGTLSGIPVAAGTYSFGITATDSNGMRSDPQAFSLTVAGPRFSYVYFNGSTPLEILPGQGISLPGGTAGATTSVRFYVTNNGVASATINSLTVSGSGFTLSELPSLPLALAFAAGSPGPQSQINFRVNFRALAPGSFTGTLSIDGIRFNLTASALANTLAYRYAPSSASTVSPGQMVLLPAVGLGGLSEVNFTVVNGSNNVAVPLNAVTVSGAAFTLRNGPSLPQVLAPGQPLGFTVSFRADQPGDSRGVLTIDGESFDLIGPAVAVTLAGPPDTNIGPAEQPSIGVRLAAPVSVPLTGQLTLAFTPNATVAADDQEIRFVAGGRSQDFSIPAGQTAAQFTGSATSLRFQTGTTAGSISFGVRVSSGAAPITLGSSPALTITLSQRAPVIVPGTVRLLNRSSAGFDIELTGYSTPREVTQAVFSFSPRPGQSLQTTSVTVDASAAARSWFQNPASAQRGSQFVYTQRFTVSQGEVGAVESVSVTLRNGRGDSAPATVSF